MPISLHVLCSKCEDVHKPPKLLFTSHIKSEKQNTVNQNDISEYGKFKSRAMPAVFYIMILK